MKYWAQFYRYSTQYKKWVEGDNMRGVVMLDGRLSSTNMERLAYNTCKDRGYDGYRVYRAPKYDKYNPDGFAMTAAVKPIRTEYTL